MLTPGHPLEPVPQQGEGGGAELLDPAAAGVGGEVGERHVQVEGAARSVQAPARFGRLGRPVPVARSSARCGCASIPSAEARRTSRSRSSPSRPSSPARSPTVAVEVERVQGVQPGGEQGGGGGLAVVQPDPAVFQGVLLDRGGLVGVAPQPGLVEDRVQRRHPVVPAGDREVPVHERHRLPGELGGGLGDLAGLPRLQATVLDEGPQAREPVAELDRLRDQRETRRVREIRALPRAPRPRTPRPPVSRPRRAVPGRRTPDPAPRPRPPVRWVGKVAAGCTSVTGCRSTQCTANASSSASAWSAARRAETTASSTAAASRSRTSGAASVSSGVLVIRET